MSNIKIFEKEISKLPVAITIKDAADMKEASEARAQLKRMENAADEEKQKVLKPLNAARTAELKRWKPIETQISNALGILDKEMTRYQTEQQRIADKETAKIAARIGEGKGKLKVETAIKQIAQVDAPESEIVTDSGGTGFFAHPCFEVVDMTLLPTDYLLANEPMIRAAMKDGKELPGVRYWIEQRPVNR